ncbi:MAG: hypothetical protein AAF197_00535 [Pseudomonadota bacterium]
MINESQFRSGQKPAFQSTIGAHFRHLIEHYRCFFAQYPTGEICFEARERDGNLESNISYAKQAVLETIGHLEEMYGQVADCTLTMEDQQSDQRLTTNLARELLFLQAHTVHHYAMIAAMTRSLGVSPTGDFGVAIATRTFNATQETGLPNQSEATGDNTAHNDVEGGSQCAH